MGVLHGNRDRVEPPDPNLAKSRDPLADPIRAYQICRINAAAHYELPMEKKVPWNGAVSMRSRAGSWETLSICIALRHNQGAPADMHANALGILIISRFPLA